MARKEGIVSQLKSYSTGVFAFGEALSLFISQTGDNMIVDIDKQLVLKSRRYHNEPHADLTNITLVKGQVEQINTLAEELWYKMRDLELTLGTHTLDNKIDPHF